MLRHMFASKVCVVAAFSVQQMNFLVGSHVLVTSRNFQILTSFHWQFSPWHQNIISTPFVVLVHCNLCQLGIVTWCYFSWNGSCFVCSLTSRSIAILPQISVSTSGLSIMYTHPGFWKPPSTLSCLPPSFSLWCSGKESVRNGPASGSKHPEMANYAKFLPGQRQKTPEETGQSQRSDMT